MARTEENVSAVDGGVGVKPGGPARVSLFHMSNSPRDRSGAGVRGANHQSWSWPKVL